MSADSKATKDEIQCNRNEAYQGGWDDGYAEGFGKAVTDLSSAAVAAALEAAAGIAYKAWDGEPEDGEAVRSEIRALITPAQHDALAAHVAAEVAKARADAMEACAVIADKHRAYIVGHHPDVERSDRAAQGYGNAAINIAVEIRTKYWSIK